MIQRESDLDRSLYDGTISAILELEDMRINDIIEFSYTVNGFNPLMKDNYYERFYLEFSISIDHFYRSILSNKPLLFKYETEEIEPTLDEIGTYYKYQWHLENTPIKFTNNFLPPWKSSYNKVSISSTNSWQDIVKWALPLYNISQEQKNELKNKVRSELSLKGTESDIFEAIRFVQDEIRYLGFEEGISAYKPHPPTQILNQRFGDCKDKSLLLSSIFGMMNVTSSPVLVHTELGPSLKDMLPSPNAFNHCIVKFEFNNVNYYVDPTISEQGGNLKSFNNPPYKYGLAINDSSVDLEPISNSIIPIEKVEEIFFIDSIGGDIELNIKSTYYSSSADQIRAQYARMSKSQIIEQYTNFYASAYPNIEGHSLNISDDYRKTKNEIIIEESYGIQNSWYDIDNNGVLIFKLNNLLLSNLVNLSKPKDNNSPYYLGNPIDYIQTTIIALPESWNIKNDDFNLSNEYFDFKTSTRYSQDSIQLKYRYYLKKEEIEPKDIDRIFKDFTKVNENLGYSLSYNTSLIKGENSSHNYYFIGLSLMGLIISIYLGFYLFNTYDPLPKGVYPGSEISGWLLLPPLGLIVNFISSTYIFFDSIAQGNYSIAIWQNLWTTSSYEYGKLLLILTVIEVLFTIMFIFYTGVLLVLYYYRRTSIPNLMIIFYSLLILFPLITNLCLHAIAQSETIFDAEYIRILLVGCFWIAVFLTSSRVKKTFVVQKEHINMG